MKKNIKVEAILYRTLVLYNKKKLWPCRLQFSHFLLGELKPALCMSHRAHTQSQNDSVSV